MNEEIQAVLAELRAGTAERDADRVEDALGQLEFFIVEEGAWHDELFSGVRHLLADPGFLAVQTSFRLARLLSENWNDLSIEQRTDIRPLLAGSFDKFADWMGAFVVAEIFGERYADEAAFTVLDDLSSSAATIPARALAAYGLGRLAKTLGQGPLYVQAVERLNALANSAIPEIRKEARAALS
jgi:hypothetical protein